MKRIFILTLIFLSITLMIYYFTPEKKWDKGVKIDKILIIKHKRELIVYSKNKILKIYKVSLGKNPVGKKHFEGDKKTPEGVYYINDKNPKSGFHLNLGISYPNKEDKEYARKFGKSPGGQIKIHGLPNGLGFIGKFHRLIDWTSGCIALTNKEIEELYYNVPIGIKVEIVK